MIDKRETIARSIACKVVSRSKLADECWTEEQKKQHVEQCWPEYAKLFEEGFINEDGQMLRSLDPLYEKLGLKAS